MKNSRTSLNKPFYDWIKEVREADKKIAELEDKLYYYNVKLIGYSSPNFEPRLSSTKPEYKDKRYILIDKICIIENRIELLRNLKISYETFRSRLDNIQIEVLDDYYLNRNISLNISRGYWYQIINDISKLFIKNCIRS